MSYLLATYEIDSLWVLYHVVAGNTVGARHDSRIPFMGVRKRGQAQVNSL